MGDAIARYLAGVILATLVGAVIVGVGVSLLAQRGCRYYKEHVKNTVK